MDTTGLQICFWGSPWRGGSKLNFAPHFSLPLWAKSYFHPIFIDQETKVLKSINLLKVPKQVLSCLGSLFLVGTCHSVGGSL